MRGNRTCHTRETEQPRKDETPWNSYSTEGRGGFRSAGGGDTLLWPQGVIPQRVAVVVHVHDNAESVVDQVVACGVACADSAV